jgi:hypothetical protein
MENTKSIYAIANDVANRYRNDSGRQEVVEGLPFHMYETVREAEYFTSGHYITGDLDENGDLKPFADVVTRLLENQRSAEEIDSSDLVIATDDPDYYTRAMLVSKFNDDWRLEQNIGVFLNEAIEARGKYGGVLVKVIESDDELCLEAVDWNSFTGDPQDLRSGIKVINHFYTPSQLIEVAKERGWDLEAATKAIELYAEAELSDSYKEQKETQGDYVLVREISGDLPEQLLNENAEQYSYVHQVHYVAGTELKDEAGDSKGVTLFASELEKSPYYYLPYKKRGANDRMLGIGVVERAKHGQVQMNRAAQQYKRAMDFASTHVLQSASKNLKGKNVLTEMRNGAILQHDDGKPITGVDMSPDALAHLDNYMAQWQNIVDRATGTTSVGVGESMPSGTPYRLGAILDQNAQSAFDLRREEFGLFLNEIYTERIIPFFIKQLKKKSVLKLKFNPEEIRRLDGDVENYKANQTVLDNYFSGVYDNLPPMMKFVAMEEDRVAIMQGLDLELKRQKNRRTITDFPDGYWEDVADKLYVTVSNERRKKGIVLESLNNVLIQYLQYKPQLDADPEARKLFNQIVQTAGLDPIDFSNTAPAQQPAPVAEAPMQQPSSPLNSPEMLTAKPG